MKKYILSGIFLLFISASSYSQELGWKSWDEGYQIAKQENKTLILFVHASWCHQCQRMDKYVFNDPEIISLINEGFVPIKFDIEAKKDYQFEDQLVHGRSLLEKVCDEPVRGIPTTVFWKPGEQKQAPVIGLKDPEEFKLILKDMP